MCGGDRYLCRLPCAVSSGPLVALPKGRVALYTLLQCTLVGLCWAVSLSPFVLAFPVVIGKRIQGLRRGGEGGGKSFEQCRIEVWEEKGVVTVCY